MGGASAEKEGTRGRGLRVGEALSGRGPQEEGWGLHVGGVWSWHPRPPPPGSSSLGFTSSPSPFSSSSPENVEDSGLDSPSHVAPGPSPDSWVPRPGTPQSPPSYRAPASESRGTRPLPASDSPQPLAPSPGPWGLEAVAGGGESRSQSYQSPGWGRLGTYCGQGLNGVLGIAQNPHPCRDNNEMHI